MSNTNNWRTFKAWFTFRPWQRHGLVLMIGGLVYICFGLSLIIVVDIGSVRSESLAIGLRIASLNEWGGFFILGGLAACLSARWPAFANGWGYAVLCGLGTAWSAVHILGYILLGTPGANLLTGLVWGLLAFQWWAVSGLTNPDRRRRPRNGPD